MFLKFWIFSLWVIKIVADDDHDRAAFPFWKVKLQHFSLARRSIEIIVLSRAIGLKIRR